MFVKLWKWIWCKIVHWDAMQIAWERWANDDAAIFECRQCGRRWAKGAQPCNRMALYKWAHNNKRALHRDDENPETLELIEE